MTPRRNARRLARELKHAPTVFDLDEESPWPLPEPNRHEPPNSKNQLHEALAEGDDSCIATED